MAVIGNTYVTLADNLKRTNPDGTIADIIEILSETNPIMDDAIVLEGNLPTGHRTTIRTGLPEGTWRKLYEGVQPTKSTTKQVDDSAGMLEAYSDIDKDLADLNGNTAAFRLSESQAHLEGLNIQMAETLFYGNTDTEPEKFMGLSPRFNDTSAENGSQIIDGGGQGSDNTSIWMISWDPTTCHMFYPKGSVAGLQRTDKGQVTVDADNGGMYEAYREHFQWKMGLSVRDWRYIVRIANIDVSELSDAGQSGFDGADLINLMIDGANQMQGLNKGNTAIYCNRTVKTALDKLASTKDNVQLSIDEYAGKPTTMFWGLPIRVVDALVNTEEAVS